MSEPEGAGCPAGRSASSPWRPSAALRSACRDLRIHPDTLEAQAVVAQQHGNPQLAENLRRAAELTALGDDEVLAIYDALRPGRSTPAELTGLAASLAGRGLPRCAALLTEAADVYTRRGLTR